MKLSQLTRAATESFSRVTATLAALPTKREGRPRLG